MYTPPLFNISKKDRTLSFYGRVILLFLIGGVSFVTVKDHLEAYIYNEYHQPTDSFVYVDASAHGIENGSYQYPFATITQALELSQDREMPTILLIASGTYAENLTLTTSVSLLGIDPEGPPIIHSDPKTSNKPTITITKDSTLHNLTIQRGKYGLYIKEDTSANILHSTIQHGSKFGIYNELPTEDEPLPSIKILSSEVSYNARQGIYLQKSITSVKNSIVRNNGEEGLDLHVGMTAHVRNNVFRDNGESGIETEIGDNTLLIEDNLFENNIKNGFNAQSTEALGSISLIRNTMIGNQKFGLRCAIHSKLSENYFKNSVKRKFNKYFSNTENIDPNCSR